jgi:hypothetical protein
MQVQEELCATDVTLGVVRADGVLSPSKPGGGVCPARGAAGVRAEHSRDVDLNVARLAGRG